MYIKQFICVAMFFFVVAACHHEATKVENTRTVRFALEDIGVDASPEVVTEKVSAFVFQNGLFYRSLFDLSLTTSGEISITLPVGSVVCFLCGISDVSALFALKEGETTLSSFLEYTYSPVGKHTATRAPEFVSGEFHITSQLDENIVHKIALKRSVARYDLDTNHDAKITVDRIVLENSSASTRLFSADFPTSSVDKCQYEILFDSPVSGIVHDLFRTYESNDPIAITVYGRYDNVPFVVRMQQLKVERNKLYKLVVKNVGASITGIFEVLPWDDGGIVEGLPDVSEKIKIDIPYSTIPSDVVLKAEENEVNIPYTGTNMVLAFRADSQIEIASIEGQTADVKIVSIGSPITTSDGVVSTYNLEVAPQEKGRLSYSVILNMKHALQLHAYDQVRIVVERSAYQIEEVELGGVTWMAFNARSRNINDQIYPLDGSSVEDMYNLNWSTAIGGLFQWGRMFMYIPWESGGHNLGGQNIDAPWIKETHVPCPAGYRIPTQGELRKLFPNNQPIPGTIVYNGEKVDITIRTATEILTTPTGVRGTPRFLEFRSQRTGRKLFIPLGGHKGDKSTTNNPNFGQGLFLWSNDNKGATGGWSYGAKFWPGTAVSGVVVSNAQLQSDAYASLRCLKK